MLICVYLLSLFNWSILIIVFYVLHHQMKQKYKISLFNTKCNGIGWVPNIFPSFIVLEQKNFLFVN